MLIGRHPACSQDPFAEPFHRPVVIWSFVVSLNTFPPQVSSVRVDASTALCSLGLGDASGNTEPACLPASRPLLLLPSLFPEVDPLPLCSLQDLLSVASVSLGDLSLALPGSSGYFLRSCLTLTPILWPHCSICWDGPPHRGLLPGSLPLCQLLSWASWDRHLQGFVFPWNWSFSPVPAILFPRMWW